MQFSENVALKETWKVVYRVEFPQVTDSMFKANPMNLDMPRMSEILHYVKNLAPHLARIASKGSTKILAQRFAELLALYSSHKQTITPVPEEKNKELVIPPLSIEMVWEAFLWRPSFYAKETMSRFGDNVLPHSLCVGDSKVFSSSVLMPIMQNSK